MAELYSDSSVLWKIELARDEITCLLRRFVSKELKKRLGAF